MREAHELLERYAASLSTIITNLDLAAVGRLAELILETRDNGKTIFFIGNGGSASTASHFANDLSIGTKLSRNPIKSVALTDNLSVITAIANDFGYEFVFAKQLSYLGSRGDLLISISASGNSPNLLEATNVAKACGINTFALVAFDGGMLKQISDDSIHVLTDHGEYGLAEDSHLAINHMIAKFIKLTNE